MSKKTIFKTLAMAMLMPAMLLTTACSSDDAIIDDNNIEPAKKGYTLPVTINVTRQDGDATRATYTDNGDGTGSLGFSAGDKLLVWNYNGGTAGEYAGVLDWVSGGTFSGTIYTQNEYTGTVDALLAAGDKATAKLIPAGYDAYGYITIIAANYQTCDEMDITKAFVASTTEKTAKVLAVEQFSHETAGYSGGFALTPNNAILNFTITGLTPSTEVTAALTDDSFSTSKVISGNVTTDAEGKATFAMGISGATETKDLTLTVGGNAIALPSDKVLVAGKIYNITRSATATTLSELKTAIDAGKNCSSYIGWEVNSAGAIAASGISGTKIGYVALVSTSDVDAGVSGSRILVLANADAGTSILWGSYGASRNLTADDLNGYSNTNTLQGYGSEAHPAAYAAWNYSAAIPSGGATPAHWFMPTKKQWENMRDVHGGSNLNNRNAMNSAFGISGNYWSSTEYNNVRAYRFSTNGGLQYYVKNGTSATNVRAVFAY